MRNGGDGGGRVRDVAAVAGAWRAGIRGCRQLGGAFQPIAPQPQQDFRAAFEPPDGGADGHVSSAGCQGRRERTTNAVDLVVARAFRGPAGGVGFEGGIGDEIAAAGIKHLDIIDQALAGVLQQHLQLIRGDIPIVDRARGGDDGPGNFMCLIAVRPVRRQAMVGVRVNQLEARSPAGGPLGPAAARAPSDFIHRDMDRVGLRRAGLIGCHGRVGHC